MTFEPDLEQRIREFEEALDDEQLEFALVALAQRRGRAAPRILARLADTWPAEQSALLDAAARLVARHQALAGDEEPVRSLLELLASQHELASRLGGEPRRVLDEQERVLLLQAQIEGEALRAIWDEPMLESRDAAVALGARRENRERCATLPRTLLAARPAVGSRLSLPGLPVRFGAPRRGARGANGQRAARCRGDPWGVASWWISRNDRLAARPCDLVGTERAGELAAAARALTEPLG